MIAWMAQEISLRRTATSSSRPVAFEVVTGTPPMNVIEADPVPRARALDPEPSWLRRLASRWSIWGRISRALVTRTSRSPTNGIDFVALVSR